MNFLNKMKSDSKAIIRSLQNMNESLLNTLVDYQDVIYEKTEVIDNLHDVIKGMTNEIKSLKQEIERLKGDKCDG